MQSQEHQEDTCGTALTSEQTWIGLRSQPCFLSGKGLREIICLDWKDFVDDLRYAREAGLITLCLTGGADGPSLASPSSNPSLWELRWNTCILRGWMWGIGLRAAAFSLCRPKSLTSLFSLSIRLPFANASSLWWGLVVQLCSCLFLLGAGGVNQIGTFEGEKLKSLGELLSWLWPEQKKRRRSASSLSKEATASPWILAIPRATKPWWEASKANCLKTCRQKHYASQEACLAKQYFILPKIQTYNVQFPFSIYLSDDVALDMTFDAAR